LAINQFIGFSEQAILRICLQLNNLPLPAYYYQSIFIYDKMEVEWL